MTDTATYTVSTEIMCPFKDEWEVIEKIEGLCKRDAATLAKYLKADIVKNDKDYIRIRFTKIS